MTSTLQEGLDAICMQRIANIALFGNDPGEHPHLRLHDLSLRTQRLIGRTLEKALENKKPHHSDDMIYLSVLEQFGVDCPHIPGEGSYTELFSKRTIWPCRICGAVMVSDVETA